MATAKKLLEAFRIVAYGTDPKDVLKGLDVLREGVAGRTMREYKIRDHMLAKIPATELLAEAAKIDDRHGLLRLAARIMGQTRGRSALYAPFLVEYVREGGEYLLKPVGPLNAQPGFLIAYAFWTLAKSVPVSTWKSRSRRCNLKSCGRRITPGGKGRGRRYCCPEHQIEAKRNPKRGAGR